MLTVKQAAEKLGISVSLVYGLCAAGTGVVMFTVKQAAEILVISPSLMYELCARKAIRFERIGFGRGTIRIPFDAIEEYRRKRTVGVAEATPTPVVRKKITLRHLDV